MSYYISGKITDVNREKELANMQLFYDAEERLLKEGYKDIFNPAKLEKDGFTWEQYLARDLYYIFENKPTILLLPNWHKSRGARLEVETAKLLGLEIREIKS